jgi:hypothetical protein
MIVSKIQKLTNLVRVRLSLGPHTHRDKPLSRILFSSPKKRGARAMGKRDGNTNTGEGVKGKKVRTT